MFLNIIYRPRLNLNEIMNSQNAQNNAEVKFNGNVDHLSTPSVNKITPNKMDKRNHSPTESESSGVSSGYGDGGSPQLNTNSNQSNGNEEHTLLGLMVFLSYLYT